MRHAAAVFATLLALDVLVGASWWFGIKLDISLANNPLSDLAPLVLGYLAVPAAAVVALAAGLARRVVKPELAEGASNAVDLLWRPAAAALLVATGFAGMVLFKDGRAGQAAAVLGVVLVAALVGLLLVTLVVRRVPLRSLVTAAVVLVVVVLGSMLVADLIGRSRLAALREEALREVAVLRQQEQAAVRPVLREPGLDANAVDAYRTLLARQRARLESKDATALAGDLGKALRSPGQPLSPAVAAALAGALADVAELREATRSRRVAWAHEYEKGLRAPLPDLLAVRMLALLAVLSGHEQAAAGDVAGAAETYLDVLRFGTDLGSGPLISTLIGTAVEKMALEALARLVRSPRGAPTLDRVDAGVALLEPALLEIGPAWRGERLSFAAMGPIDDGAEFARGLDAVGIVDPIPPQLVPWNAYAATAVELSNRTFREIEAAAANPDPRALRAIEGDFLARYYMANPNFVYRVALPSLLRAGLSIDEVRVLAAALRTAVGLERRRAADGRYPADPGPLPADRMVSDGTPLRYRTDASGASYALYGVGFDLADDGGKPEEDTVLPAAGWPEPATAIRIG